MQDERNERSSIGDQRPVPSVGTGKRGSLKLNYSRYQERVYTFTRINQSNQGLLVFLIPVYCDCRGQYRQIIAFLKNEFREPSLVSHTTADYGCFTFPAGSSSPSCIKSCTLEQGKRKAVNRYSNNHGQLLNMPLAGSQ